MPSLFKLRLSEAEANLTTARARVEKTKNDVARYTPLAKARVWLASDMGN
jgi:multidrug resistance efflux pump